MHSDANDLREPRDIREIERELCGHELRDIDDAPAWARFIVLLCPEDVPVRLAMGKEIAARFKAGAALKARIGSPGRGRFVFDVKGEPRAEVHVFGRAPADCSCDCADYLRNALGICAHAVVARRKARGQFAPLPILDWDPIRPWRGDDQPWSRLLRRLGSRGDRFTDIDGWDREDWCALVGGTWRFDAARDDDALMAAADRVAVMLTEVGERAAPAARAIVQALGRHVALLRELERVTSATSSAGSPRRWGASQPELRRKLFPYQEEGAKCLIGRGRLLLGDEMGLGKTTQAIAACSALVSSGAIERALFIVPASLKWQWQREWREVSRVPLTLVEGKSAERQAKLAAMPKGMALMNYEQVVREIVALREWSPDLVVIDEAQRIKNSATKTALTLKSLTPRYRWLLTGTPFENRLGELASLVEWIDDFALEPKWRLEPFHSLRRDGGTLGGAANLRTLRARFRPRVLRRTRAEVLQELPARVDTKLVVPLTIDQVLLQDALSHRIRPLVDLLRWRQLTPAEHIELMKLLGRQRLISNGLMLAKADQYAGLMGEPPGCALDRIGSPKLTEFRELVRALVVEEGKKLVVFSQWRHMLDWAAWSVRDLLGDSELESAFFTGAVGLERRRENVIRFHDDDALRILFVTDAGGVGLNLQRAASAMVNFEVPWNPAVLEQRIGRIHRFGQAKPVQVFLMQSETGIEARLATLVRDKHALFRNLFETDVDAFVHEPESFFRDHQDMPSEWDPREPEPEPSDDGADGASAACYLTGARTRTGSALASPRPGQGTTSS